MCKLYLASIFYFLLSIIFSTLKHIHSQVFKTIFDTLSNKNDQNSIYFVEATYSVLRPELSTGSMLA